MADYSDLGIIPVNPAPQAGPAVNKYADLGIIPAQNGGARSLAASSPDAGLVDALVKGAAQGSTFGFGDEIGGLAGALGDRSASQGFLGASGEALSAIPKALGITDGAAADKFLQAYRKIRPEVREDFKSAEDNHPMATLLGNLAGGVLTGGAAKSLGVIGEAAKGKDALARIGQAAKAGAGIGALTGLGGSEADLTTGRNDDAIQAMKDSLEGAGVGAVTGGALSGTAEGLGAAGKIIKKRAEPYGDLRIFKAMKDAYKFGNEDQINLTGNNAFKDAGENLSNVTKSISDTLDTVVGDLQKVKDGLLSDADAKGVLGDATNALNTALKRAKTLPENTPLERSEKEKLVSVILDRLQGVEKEKTVTANFKTFKPGKTSIGTPSTEQEMKDEKLLHDVSDMFQGETPMRHINIIDAPDGSGRKIGLIHDANTGKTKVKFLNPEIPPVSPDDAVSVQPGQFSKTITTREGGQPIAPISDIDQLKKSYQSYAFDQNYRNPEAESITKGLAHDVKEAAEAPFDQTKTTYNPFTNQDETETFNPLKDVNEKMHNTFLAKDNLPNVQTLQQKEGTSNSSVNATDKVAQFLNHLKTAAPDVADEVSGDLDKAASRFDLAKMANPSHGFGKITGTAKALAVSGANTAGLLARDFADATPESIKAFGGVLGESAGAVGKGLSNVFNEMAMKDSKGRNATVFALSQNPQYRQAIESLAPDFFTSGFNQKQ